MACGGKLATSLYYALERVNETTAFVFHRVDPEFSPYGSFSSVTLKLEVHSSGKPPHQEAIQFNTLFKVDFEATNSEFDEARKFIRHCRKRIWPPFHSNSEKSVMLEIASQILVHLCPEVTMEKRYSSLVASNPACGTIRTSPLGMGSVEMWHGTPDTRVRGGVVFCESGEGEELMCESEDNESSGSEESSKSEQSDGKTVNIEGKVQSKAANLQQVVATCVVSSFTEIKSHPGRLALIPTILIDKKSFIICLYDCKKDVLLISNKKSLCTNGHLSQSGIALLWTVLNHR